MSQWAPNVASAAGRWSKCFDHKNFTSPSSSLDVVLPLNFQATVPTGRPPIAVNRNESTKILVSLKLQIHFLGASRATHRNPKTPLESSRLGAFSATLSPEWRTFLAIIVFDAFSRLCADFTSSHFHPNRLWPPSASSNDSPQLTLANLSPTDAPNSCQGSSLHIEALEAAYSLVVNTNYVLKGVGIRVARHHLLPMGGPNLRTNRQEQARSPSSESREAPEHGAKGKKSNFKSQRKVDFDTLEGPPPRRIRFQEIIKKDHLQPNDGRWDVLTNPTGLRSTKIPDGNFPIEKPRRPAAAQPIMTAPAVDFTTMFQNPEFLKGMANLVPQSCHHHPTINHKVELLQYTLTRGCLAWSVVVGLVTGGEEFDLFQGLFSKWGPFSGFWHFGRKPLQNPSLRVAISMSSVAVTGFLSASTRCCSSLSELKEAAGVEETDSMPVGQFLEKSSEKKPTLVSQKETKYTTLADLFRVHQCGLTETLKDSQSTEALSDMLLDYNGTGRKTDFESSSHPNDLLPTQPTSVTQNGKSMHYEGGQKSSLSNKANKLLDFKERYSKSANNQAADVTDKLRSPEFLYEPHRLLGEPQRKQDSEKVPVIKELLDFIRSHEPPKSTSTGCDNACAAKEKSLNGSNLHVPDDNDLLASGNFVDEASKIEDEDKSNSEFGPKINKDQRRLKGTLLSRKKSEENRVLVRFLRTHMTKNQILKHFRSWGTLVDAKFHDSVMSQYISADICFQTREELTEALEKLGSSLRSWIIVESADSRERLKVPIPSLMGDLNVPSALIKKPTRTIKIENLTNEISSCHIKEALAFCGSNVSGYVLGLTPTVAYVEFETETGKERALAERFINVLGRQLLMQRIDIPRTTAVRISSTLALRQDTLHSVCESLGIVRSTVQRSLNGLEIDGIRVRAEPAPVYPHDVLLALWHQPEGRKHLKATMQVLLRKLREDTLDTSELASLQALFVDKV
ncbi:RNA-binding (RRM/RBD/RNP motifs) family protein [Striga asiatica]|uniref:RNA-binding (RRM/RBD/RNP motifs) family protein n=1 Tax=Striga asiatica TaxID=4170 RepID=A0A5A7Q9X0_STRAF|nr:RNA-binding (RRM/RBD/RNP motifs) family protein [Striga asiatica]